MDGDGELSKFGLEEKSCRSVKKAVRDKEKTFQDYIDTYIIEVLTTQEVTKRYKNMSLPEYYKTTENDFFFLGHKLKEGKDRSENFIWDDLFIFMVRKEGEIW